MPTERLFELGEALLVGLMCAWTFALWRNRPFTRSVVFRTIPFALTAGLFALAFYSEHLH